MATDSLAQPGKASGHRNSNAATPWASTHKPRDCWKTCRILTRKSRTSQGAKSPASTRTHAERTRHGYFGEQGNFIGSGVIGAGCKSIIGRRLKQSFMFWSGSGEGNIPGLRSIIRSPHFQAAWQARRPVIASRKSKARRWKAAS